MFTRSNPLTDALRLVAVVAAITACAGSSTPSDEGVSTPPALSQDISPTPSEIEEDTTFLARCQRMGGKPVDAASRPVPSSAGAVRDGVLTISACIAPPQPRIWQPMTMLVRSLDTEAHTAPGHCDNTTRFGDEPSNRPTPVCQPACAPAATASEPSPVPPTDEEFEHVYDEPGTFEVVIRRTSGTGCPRSSGVMGSSAELTFDIRVERGP